MGIPTVASQESVVASTAGPDSPKRILLENPAIDLKEPAAADGELLRRPHERTQALRTGGAVCIIPRKWYLDPGPDAVPLTSAAAAAPLADCMAAPMKVSTMPPYADSMMGAPKKVKILSAPPGLDPPAPDLVGSGFEDQDYVTTVMVRNIACRYSQEDVAKILDENGMGDKYDFIYLPRTHQRVQKKSQSNFGYTFVNFTEPEYAKECYKKFHGKPFGNATMRLCEIGPARVQGAANASHNLHKKHKKNRGPLVLKEFKDATPQDEDGNPIPPYQ